MRAGVTNPVSLTIYRDRIVKGFFWSVVSTAIVLFLADATFNRMEWISEEGMQRFFNSTREDSLSNWISSLVQIGLAGFSFLLAFLSSESSETKSTVRGWIGSGILFTMVALDDGTKLHERLGPVLRQLADWYPSYQWQVTFGALYGVAGLSVLIFLYRQLNPHHLMKYIWLFIGFILFAQFLDFLEGIDTAVYKPVAEFLGLRTSTVRHYSKTFEEMIEVIGFSFMGVSLLSFILIKLSRFRALEVAPAGDSQ